MAPVTLTSWAKSGLADLLKSREQSCVHLSPCSEGVVATVTLCHERTLPGLPMTYDRGVMLPKDCCLQEGRNWHCDAFVSECQFRLGYQKHFRPFLWRKKHNCLRGALCEESELAKFQNLHMEKKIILCPRPATLCSMEMEGKGSHFR